MKGVGKTSVDGDVIRSAAHLARRVGWIPHLVEGLNGADQSIRISVARIPAVSLPVGRDIGI